MSSPDRLYPRLIKPRVVEALADTPVVLIAGPRQAGKTTLVRQLAGDGFVYITLDDQAALLAATEDPVGMIRNLDRVVIDEVQRAPQLLLSIKKTVDEDRRPGRFLLTGSANLMALPAVADSLAGRMETLTLLPLSQAELHGASLNWLDSVFSGNPPQASSPHKSGEALVEAVLRGGYPEAVSRPVPRRRSAWARQYVDAIIRRDIRDVAEIGRLDQLPRFLRALAQVAGQICNYSRLGGQVGLDHKTAARYVAVLEQLYLLKRVDVWATNRLNRMVKTPKLQFIDSGLLSMLIDLTPAMARQDRGRFGSALETFVYSELLKHATCSDGDYQLLYYRDHDQYEVDIVVERADGQVVGVEAKAAATIRAGDLRGLKRLAAISGERFAMGVLLYDGVDVLPLGDKLWAAPISGLWGQ